MREILFRGKQITDGVWVIGGIDTSTDEKPYILKRARYRPDTRDWDTAEYYEKNPTYTRACIEVVPETVGQWTGLTDKNGKKIFEGDIVYNGSGDPGIVKWFYGSFVIHFTNGDVWDVSQYIKEEYTEVIGNIHDNPELLEVK